MTGNEGDKKDGRDRDMTSTQGDIVDGVNLPEEGDVRAVPVFSEGDVLLLSEVDGLFGEKMNESSDPSDSLLTAEQVRAALRTIHSFLPDLVKEMAGAGERRFELSTPEDREMAADILRMSREIESRVLNVLPEAPFRRSAQVRPSVAAHRLIQQAKLKAAQEEEKKEKTAKLIVDTLSKIFASKVDVENPAIADKINRFAVKNASKAGLDVNEVITAFSDSEGDFFIGVNRSVLEGCFKNPDVEDIVGNPKISIFRSGVLPSKYFEQILHGKIAALIMDLRKAWQSRIVEGEYEDEFLTILMGRAKIYINETFNDKFLGKKLAGCKSLQELQGYANSLPVDKESFELLKKAHLFLKVMHIMLLHDSEVNAYSFFYNSDNLQDEMLNDFSIALPSEHRYLNPPRKPDGCPNMEFQEDLYGIEVDRIEVADGKPIYSTIDKIFRKEMYDTTEIGDFARMRIFLTKEDCYDEDGTFNPEKTEKAMEKALGLIMARFGSDVDPKSLDYSITTGKTNEASKGAHKGMHFNFKYKSSCNKNGLTPHGEPLTKSISVEGQILAYMPKEAYDEDHMEYEKSRRALLFRALGFENGFQNFAMDLISALANDKYDFEFRSIVDPFKEIANVDERVRQVYERQFGFGDEDFFPEDVNLEALMKEGWILFSEDKLRLFVLLLSILTKKDEKGELVNGEFIEYMQKYFPGKIQRIMNKLSKILKSPEFSHGGEKAYLKRVLEAKMNFVKGATSTGGKSVEKRRRALDLFRTEHSFKVTNVNKGKGSKKHPKLGLVTNFPGTGGTGGDKMEIPYEGPVGLVGIPKEGGHRIDFCWQLQNGKKSEPVYRIDYDESGSAINCFLINGDQKLLMWMMEVDFYDESFLSGRIHECEYSILKNFGNRSFIASSGIEFEGRSISVKNFNKLHPAIGMNRNQAKHIRLAEEAGKIWGQAIRGNLRAGEYPVRIAA